METKINCKVYGVPPCNVKRNENNEMYSYVKLRHRFIFVRELRPNSTFHNCKDDY